MAVAPKGYFALRQDVSKTPHFWPRHFGVSRHELVVEVPRRFARDLDSGGTHGLAKNAGSQLGLQCGGRHEIDWMSQYCGQALLQTDKPNQTNGPRKLDEQIDVALHRRSATRDGSEHVDGRHAVFEQEISLVDEAPFDGIERHAHSVTETADGDGVATGHHYLAGSLAFNSSSQFNTTTMVGACSVPVSLIIRNRCPSGETS